MEARTEALVNVLQQHLKKATPAERLEAVDALMDGYCRECGYPSPPENRCQCWNDA